METLEMQASWNCFNHYVVWGVWAGPESQKAKFLACLSSWCAPFFLCGSFEEISETTYALVVHVMGNQVVSVTVADNQSLDIARNTNSASSTLQVRHCKS
jgi:hypothetical protein